MPHLDGDPESVHLAAMTTEAPDAWLDDEVRDRFETLFKVRSKVQEAIEAKRPKSKGERQPGQIGSSQEAAVTLTANGALADLLREQSELLAELFIVSTVELAEGDLDDGLPGVVVELAGGHKCPRCWNYRTELGFDGQHDDLCSRCAEVVSQLDQ